MRVAIFRSNIAAYPDAPPFHPGQPYPELKRAGLAVTGPANAVYEGVRQTLALLKLDAAHLGTPDWNPLRHYVRPDNTVVIKPNLVLHEFGAWQGSHCLTTHGSIIRAMVDYAFLAAGPKGKIIVADAPLQGADFEQIIKQTGLAEIQEHYWRAFRAEVQVRDLRQVRAVIDEGSSFIREVRRLPGDPQGYQVIDLGQQSRLSGLDQPGTRYAVGDYDSAVTSSRHNARRHEYVVSRTILEADAVLSLPKLKTHNKVGLTVCLKNLVGMIGSKDCLPHHRYGKKNQGGDEFPADYPFRWYASQRVYNLLQGRVPLPVWRTLRAGAGRLLGAGTPTTGGAESGRGSFYPSGSWYGNDTIRRTVDDLNRILFYYHLDEARLVDEPQRRFLALVDGIVGMEGNGPLRGRAKPCGVLLAGDDPLAVDIVAATLMGFDWRRIAMLRGPVETPRSPAYSRFSGSEADLDLVSNEETELSLPILRRQHLHFEAPAGWQGHVEV